MDFSNRQNRFVRIDEVSSEYLAEIERTTQTDPFYPTYHIAPKHGLLNDPNGLSYFNGEHHLFYQWFPLGPVHGLKHWYHVSTKDFVNFTDRGIAMYPDQAYDHHGCYTGVGVPQGDELYLFYTANLLDEEQNRFPTQVMAVMDKEGKIDKKGVVVDVNFESYTSEFRDPILVDRDGEYHMLIGAQGHDEKGKLAYYRGNAIDDYEYVGNIDVGLSDFGFMWECPNYYEQDDNGVYIFSPQGVSSDNKYDLKNVFSVVYMVGDRINFDTQEFNNQGYRELDKGFDFYAPQTYLDNQGRRILIGWLGNSKSGYPTDKNNWAHMFTLPRELTIDGDYLIQAPLKELEALRASTETVNDCAELTSRAFELELEVNETFSISFANAAGERMVFSGNREEFTLDRTHVSHVHAQAFGTVRYAQRVEQAQRIRIFVDNSAIEIFADNGKTVFTSRIFIDDLNRLELEQASATLHYLSPIHIYNQTDRCDNG
ncbi:MULTISPECIES: sucrose-6-phosphate hydrolase [Vibrio]|uniref:sucrose-6-phosphate hydrolase n=1 Tax=Vibrio TaxID=662 RepID=UPI0020750EEE|nr:MULTISPECIES: sucrose-6-phosphate hydrolase [Vibrio]USD31654.1 sucrose-6-phosphate hydrolase [Vibrio sp. SCSIO 43186]USD44698.1 sucrose-6-phosphate hydrolase [Vibrio sp. SCSIO 43145]USD68777.1 sucrose-6-phosphate hydrolase [Vibrio sp. SCSIO 43139]USD96467.1 sucrose-6-phosphate hydrolase [Vibrio coralliilyticus]